MSTQDRQDKDESYTRGVHDGQEGGFLDDFSQSISTIFSMSDTSRTYDKGYEYGRLHRHEARRNKVHDKPHGSGGSGGGGGGGESLTADGSVIGGILVFVLFGSMFLSIIESQRKKAEIASRPETSLIAEARRQFAAREFLAAESVFERAIKVAKVPETVRAARASLYNVIDLEVSNADWSHPIGIPGTRFFQIHADAPIVIKDQRGEQEFHRPVSDSFRLSGETLYVKSRDKRTQRVRVFSASFDAYVAFGATGSVFIDEGEREPADLTAEEAAVPGTCVGELLAMSEACRSSLASDSPNRVVLDMFSAFVGNDDAQFGRLLPDEVWKSWRLGCDSVIDCMHESYRGREGLLNAKPHVVGRVRNNRVRVQLDTTWAQHPWGSNQRDCQGFELELVGQKWRLSSAWSIVASSCSPAT